jgi:hypothetical protein
MSMETLVIAFLIVVVMLVILVFRQTSRLQAEIKKLKAWDDQSLVWAKKAIAWIQKREGKHKATGDPTTTEPPGVGDLPGGHG